MPNEKVRFLDDKNAIKERITYVKDKDLLGFDSANSLSFQFNYWKMKLFGISDNFIAMDDDCFIGKPLKKTDFFYVSNGRITPIIITNKFIKLNKIMIKNNLISLKKTINKYKKKQSSAEFKYSLYNTYLFILDLFKEARFFPVHTHNAIPININDLKEIYDIIYDSKFKYSTLYSIYRQIDSLQFQALFLSYNYIKYKKKVKNISNKLIQNKYSLFSDYNFSLFCINTGSINYSPSSFLKTKIVMEYLFPFPNSYEINIESIAFLAYKTIFLIQIEFKNYIINKKRNIYELEMKLNNYLKKKNFKYFIIFMLLFFLFYLKMFNCLSIYSNKQIIFAY